MAEEKRYLKYGGVEFTLRAAQEEINRFVAGLPEEQRKSLYDVAVALQAAGMIEIPPDAQFTTVDEDFLELVQVEESRIHDIPMRDLCPSCKTPLRFTSDVPEGARIRCAACGTDLVATFTEGKTFDLRLASEIE